MLATCPMICVIVPEGDLPEWDREAPCGYVTAGYAGVGMDFCLKLNGEPAKVRRTERTTLPASGLRASTLPTVVDDRPWAGADSA
jgi:hypothetical protein